MHIEVVYIPEDADAFWLLERLQGVRAPRVVLVLPEQAPAALASPLVWKRVRYRAWTLGLHLAVVAPDPEARWAVRQARIPLLRRVEQAWKRPWKPLRPLFRRRRPRGREALRELGRARPRPSREPSARERRWALGALFLTGLLLLSFTLPRVEVVLSLPAREARWEAQVLLSPEFRQAQPALPGLPLEPVTVEVVGWRVEPATGRVQVPTQPARVRLLWTNLTDRPITLPPGLVVADVEGQMTFVLLEGGRLEPGPGTTLVLPAQAAQPGPQGNLPAHRLRVLPPLWSWQVTVTNPEPARGGAASEVTTWKAGDVERAQQALDRALASQALRLLQVQDAQDRWLFPETLELDQVLEQRVWPPEGAPARWVLVYQRRRYRAWAVPRQALDRLVHQAMELSLPPGHTWWPDSVQVSLELLDPQGPPYTARLQVAWWEVPALAPVEAAWQMALRPTTRALAAWQERVGAQARAYFWPVQWPWMPLGFRIQVHLQAQPAPEGPP